MQLRSTSLRLSLAALAGTLMTTSAAAQQTLATIDSTGDVVLLLDPMDGSVTNPAFIDIAAGAAAAGYTGSTTPIEAIQVGDEIWISDQLADRIWRFDLATQAFIDDIGVDSAGDGQLNNIRGIEYVGDTVYGSIGTDNTAGTVLRGIVTIDVPSLTVTGSFNGRDLADTSYFDVYYNGTELLVPNIDTGNDGIERYALDGTFLGILVSSDGVASFDFLEQISADGADYLAAGFSPPSGVFSISSEGDDNGIIAGLDRGIRGCWRLGNGEVLWTNGSVVATDTEDKATGGSFRFISMFDLGGAECTGDIADDFGTPGADGMISFGDFLALLGLVGDCPGMVPGCTGDIADDFGTTGADGMVSFGDFLALLGLVGPCP